MEILALKMLIGGICALGGGAKYEFMSNALTNRERGLFLYNCCIFKVQIIKHTVFLDAHKSHRSQCVPCT